MPTELMRELWQSLPPPIYLVGFPSARYLHVAFQDRSACISRNASLGQRVCWESLTTKGTKCVFCCILRVEMGKSSETALRQVRSLETERLSVGMSSHPAALSTRPTSSGW